MGLWDGAMDWATKGDELVDGGIKNEPRRTSFAWYSSVSAFALFVLSRSDSFVFLFALSTLA